MKIKSRAKLLLLLATVSSVLNVNTSVLALGRRVTVPNLHITQEETVRIAGRTPLHSAVYVRDLEFVRELLARGVDVNVADTEGVTPLYAAVNDYLLSVRAQDTAAAHIDLEIVNALLNDSRINPSLNFACSHDQGGNTVLHRAVQCGNITIIRELLRAGASIWTYDDRGLYPVDYALTLNEGVRREVMSALLEVSADLSWEELLGVYARREPPHLGIYVDNALHRAVRYNSMDMVNVLLTIPGIRESIDATNSYREAPLHVAIRRRNYAMVEALLQAGAARNCRSRAYALTVEQGELPIAYAERHIDDPAERERMIGLLRRYGCQ